MVNTSWPAGQCGELTGEGAANFKKSLQNKYKTKEQEASI